MKKCFSTLSTMELSQEEVIALAQKNNIEGIEIRMTDFSGVFNKEIERAEEIKTAFKKAEIEIVGLATSVFIKKYDEEVLKNAKSCIDYAHALNAKGIRVFLSYFNGEKDFCGICKALNELSEYAKEKNVEIWLETHSEFSTGKSISEVLNECNKENIKVIWDVIHTVEYGEAPNDTVKILKNKIVHIHIKDGLFDENTKPYYRQTALGAGTVPIDEMYKALKKIEYNGYLSLEWEAPWHPELKECYPSPDALIKAFIRFIRFI